MILENSKSIKGLAEKLSKIRAVSKFDSDDEPECWRIAHSLSDLEGSFHEVINVLIPKLASADDDKSLEDTLHDIGEELRHILYHIKDPRFFAYLFEE